MGRLCRGQGRDVLLHRYPGSPWNVVDANDKKEARLNVISHLLGIVPYKDVPHEKIELPHRQQRSYERPPIDSQTWVPKRFVVK